MMNKLAKKLKNKFLLEKGKSIAAIIVSGYNNFNYTKQCINSIIKNKDKSYNYILYVFDDASPEKETERYFEKNINNLKINTRYFKYKTNQQLTQSWNDGINFAFKEDKADYIILLNNDTITTPNWSKNLINFLKKTKSGPVSPITNSKGSGVKEQRITHYFPKAKINIKNMNSTLNKIKPPNKAIKAKWFVAFCIALSKNMLNNNVYKVKGNYKIFFNPSYVYGNELEFMARGLSKGFQPYILLNSFVYHYQGKSQMPERTGILADFFADTGLIGEPRSVKDNNEIQFFMQGFLSDPYKGNKIKSKYPFKIPTWRLEELTSALKRYQNNLKKQKNKIKASKEEICFNLGVIYRILLDEFGDLRRDINTNKKIYFKDCLSHKLKKKLR